MTQITTTPSALITGANGKLGQLLRLSWSQNPPPGINPLYLARMNPADLIWSPGDSLETLPSCGTIIAVWGRTAGKTDELEQNTALAHHALELARGCGASRVLHFSSAAIYGLGQDLSESTTPAPINAYGRAKLAMEDCIRAFPSEGINHCCLRLANVVGADSLAPALRPSSQPLILDRFPDGLGPLRSYIAPGDLARVLAALTVLAQEDLPATLNIAAPKPVSMESLARAAGRSIHWQNAPKTSPQNVTLNSTRLERLLPGVVSLTKAQGMVADWQELEALS